MSIFRLSKRCLLCHEYTQAACICPACQQDLRGVLRTQNYCPTCPQSSLHGLPCTACQQQPPAYRHFWASADYMSPLPELLHRWKHLRQTAYHSVFTWLMQHNPPAWLPECDADCVLAMPISRQRRLLRGFNQCDELANWITQRYTIPVLPSKNVIRRHKVAQSTLNRAERQQNIQGIFLPTESVKNRKILIVDDICTTKSTISELASSLHQSGAAAVYAWVVACN